MTDVFDQNTTTTTVAPVSDNPLADKLKTIVNESGQPKYDSIEKALDALAPSQAHIQRLEAEARAKDELLQELKAKALKAEALDEVVQRLQQNNQQPRQETPPSAGMSEQATIEALEKIIDKKAAIDKAQNNVQVVQQTLIAKFGDAEKTKVAVAAKAAELGLTTQELGALSSKSPLAVLAYFGEKPISNQSVTPSNSTPLSNPSNGEPLKAPTKSLLLGSTSKEQKEYMKKVKEEVYKRHGITS